MSHKFFLGFPKLLLPTMVALLVITACASPTGVGTTQPSFSDQVATIVAATMEAFPSNMPEPTAESTQALTFDASDSASDCFNSSGVLDACAGPDLVGVQVGLQAMVLNVPNDPKVPVVFVVSFADLLDAMEEFDLYLYLDLDQNPTTGFDMSSGAGALPGIDRLVGVTLPSGESWTQVVASVGYEAEIIKDDRVSASVMGNKVIVLVGRAILDERAPVGREEQTQLAVGAMLPMIHELRPAAGGGAPDDFTLYIGIARSTNAFDYFNGNQNIQAPLGMTVPTKVMYPPNGGGGS